MSYVETVAGVTRDELLGGHEIPLELWNVNVGASAVIERGMLLGASSPTATFDLVNSSLDASKCLVIASSDFTANSISGHVTTAYSSGLFNRDKIILGGTSALTLDLFVNEMRKQNLHVTDIKNLF